MGIDSPDDKRTFGRVDAGNKVACRVIEIGSDNEFDDTELTVKNISPGGVSFESNTVLPQDTVIKIELKLPLSTQGEQSIVSGKVIRCSKDEKSGKYEIGIAYTRDKK
ncbi:MAG: PilZ domain-containing protein [bacterium]